MLRNKLTIAALCAISLMSTSCARNINSNTYAAGHVGEASFTHQGKIVSVRKITVQHAESLEDNTTGGMLGLVGGGLAGNQFGGGSGNTIATVVGAVGGAIAGSLIEKELKTQDGMEYAVKLTNGQMLTVVQGMDTQFSVGQKVMVMISHDGRSRVVADSSFEQDVQNEIRQPIVKIVKGYKKPGTGR